MSNGTPPETNLQTTLESLPDGVAVFTDDGATVYINQRTAEMTGYILADIRGMPPLGMLHPDEREAVKARHQRRLQGQPTENRYETAFLCKNEKSLPVEITVSHLEWEGRPATLLLIRDITERREFEKALRQSEENFRALAEMANDGISITNKRGFHTFCNQRFLNMLGYAMDEVLPLKRVDIIHGDDAAKLKAMHQARKSGEKYPGIYEVAYRRKDGSALPVEVSFMHAVWGGQRVHVFFARDISSRKRSEAERLRASRLESLAILAGGIAHEFNNSLTSILGNVSLARLEVPQGSPLSENLKDVERAAKEASRLTQQLLTFARGGDPQREELDLREAIRDGVTFTLRGSNVRCQLDLAEDLWQSRVNAAQIRQVLSNIVINAEQAMPDGGLIEVTAGNRTLSAANSTTLPPGDYARIEIRDHGVGIPNEYINHIFDPYFTTKQGSGLGLATAYSVIKKHDGHIRASSALGEGTTITIYLPASQDQAPTPPSPVSPPAAHGSNVLLMDDEALVRNTGRRMLGRLGYRVTTAKDGAEALWLFRESLDTADRFDLTIVDLTVPGGMGALEALEKLKTLDPAARVFVSSGYSNDPVMSNCQSYGFQGVVRKPYTLEEITEVIGYAEKA